MVAVATAIVAVTRWFALSLTLWDWDEAQFVLALRHYDIAAHHPHPPGFPLFIGAAKLLQMAGLDAFHALQSIGLVASVLIVPVMTLFALAAGAEFTTALTAAIVLAFFPNVWFYGGTALSDVPSMTAVVAAVGLLLRGGSLAMYGGAIAAAIAIGVRPQNLVIVAVPFVMAIVRERMQAIGPLVVAAGIVAASYGAAIAATGGWGIFLAALRRHQAYLASTDAWTSPARPPLTHLVDDFFIRPYRAQVINIVTTLLALAAIVRRRRSTLVALASFVPFCLIAWLMLDRFSASRFSIGYAPLFAILAADGLAVLGTRIRAAGAAIYVALMILWTWPALQIVHTTVSPSVAAANWVREHAKGVVYVDPDVSAFAGALIPDRTLRTGVWSAGHDDVLLREGRGAITFSREHGHLWRLVRQRYFDVSVSPAVSPFQFEDGWYEAESNGPEVWRWMKSRSRIVVSAPCRSLSIDFYAPDSRATIMIFADGRPLDRLSASSEFPRTYAFHGAHEVVIETDRVVRNGNDPRELGLRLNGLECR